MAGSSRCGPRVLELGYAYLSGLAMPEIAAPHLEELVAKLRESSSISVLDGHHIVYVARVPSMRIMTVAISVGTRFPAFVTSMGRVLLSGLSEDDLDRYLTEASFEPLTANTVTDPVRLKEIVLEVGSQGYAIVDQELEEGLRAIAAPIRGSGDAVTAAINVSAHASRVSLEAMRTELLPAMLETARQIESDLKLRRGLGLRRDQLGPKPPHNFLLNRTANLCIDRTFGLSVIVPDLSHCYVVDVDSGGEA